MSSASPLSDRRADPRLSANGRVRLVFRSGHVLDAGLVDRSLKGLRVRLEDAASLPPDLVVLSVATGTAYEATVVWRSAPYAGLSLTRTVDMRAPATAKDAEIHRLWREHARG